MKSFCLRRHLHYQQ
jgi:hypothetical protein